MSLSSITQVQDIPTKRMLITDSNQLPHDYSSTPGGSIYSTTPGGTRIIYDRSMLLNLKNSPMSRTPPRNGVIPDYLLRGNPANRSPKTNQSPRSQLSPSRNNVRTVDEEQFVMEI